MDSLLPLVPCHGTRVSEVLPFSTELVCVWDLSALRFRYIFSCLSGVVGVYSLLKAEQDFQTHQEAAH